MKKKLLFLSLIFVYSLLNAQSVMDTYDLPSEISTSDGILFFKFVPEKLDDAALGDATICLSQGEITAWGDYSCQIRTKVLENYNYFDVRDEGNTQEGSVGNYLCLDTVKWEFDKAYYCWFTISYADHTYNVQVLPDGEEEIITIAENAAFRNVVDELYYISIVGSNMSTNDILYDIQVVEEVALPYEPDLIETEKEQFNYSIYPNPAQNSITINYKLASSQQVKISLNNLLGEEVLVVNNNLKQAGAYKETADISGLVPGVYFLTWTLENKQYVSKIVKK